LASNESVITLPQVWIATAALLALQIGAFTWRINREIRMAELGDVNWLPWPDRMNMGATLASLLVFVLPIFTHSGSALVPEGAFLVSAVLSIGYPVALASHYDLWCEGERDYERGVGLGRFVVKLFLIIALLALNLFVVIAVLNGNRGDIVAVNWNAIAAFGSAIAAVAAIAGVIVASRQIREASRLTKITTGLTALFRLEDEGREMHEEKRRAAFLLLVNQPDVGTAVANVLDFFETVAVLFRRDFIDQHLTWHTFYHWMFNFYAASREYIAARRPVDGPKQWLDLEKAIPTLMSMEGATELPDCRAIRRFLNDEREDYHDDGIGRLPQMPESD
jgi:hypothetical protein